MSRFDRHRRPTHWSKSYVTPEGDHHTIGSTSTIINTTRVPSKAAGRKGTRRAYKRAHPPGWLYRLFFPTKGA